MGTSPDNSTKTAALKRWEHEMDLRGAHLQDAHIAAVAYDADAYEPRGAPRAQQCSGAAFVIMANQVDLIRALIVEGVGRVLAEAVVAVALDALAFREEAEETAEEEENESC